MTNDEIVAVISEDERIVGIVMDGRAAPAPPVPSRGDHYTDQINFTAVMTQVETKEAQT